jgi:hypothetical protein
MTQKQTDLLLQIPVITNDKIKLFVDNQFVSELDVNQFNAYRVQIIEYISETGDDSILHRIHFIGHEDDHNEFGKEIKITFEDAYGNLTDYPYELDHVRRSLFKLTKLGRKICDEYNL